LTSLELLIETKPLSGPNLVQAHSRTSLKDQRRRKVKLKLPRKLFQVQDQRKQDVLSFLVRDQKRRRRRRRA